MKQTMDEEKPPACQVCTNPLTLKPLCPSCEGAGGWGNWLETGDDTCVTCGGTGEAPGDAAPILRFVCPECHTIEPHPDGVASWSPRKSYLERLYAGELPAHAWNGEEWIIETNNEHHG